MALTLRGFNNWSGKEDMANRRNSMRQGLGRSTQGYVQERKS